MGNVIHMTRPVQVWADVDERIAGAVQFLNTLPGVRTFASCQGTIGEGGAEPYRPYVMAYFPEEFRAQIEKGFEIGEGDAGSRMLYIKGEISQCEGCGTPCPDAYLQETPDMVMLCPLCAKL
jgi:hypothetical protein